MQTATKRKVAELEGADLDYWVARALGSSAEAARDFPVLASTEWAEGGSIIEREGIAIVRYGEKWSAYHPVVFEKSHGWWQDGAFDVHYFDGIEGPTALVAAMRAFVASKFGEEVGE